jgi:hypothetical protein
MLYSGANRPESCSGGDGGGVSTELVSLTELDEVNAHGPQLGVSDRHLVGRLRCA